jgi:hypothetical protein
MRWWMLLAFGCLLNAQPSLTIQPALITECTSYGLGHATLNWTSDGPGPVRVFVGGAGGVPMTGPSPANGSAATEDWVGDGTVFALVDDASRELARVTARVSCVSAGSMLKAALASGPYLPLQVGNQWTYRVNSRLATSTYTVWRVDRAEAIGGNVWFVLVEGSPDAVERFRPGEQGRVYRLRSDGQEELWLDPQAIGSTSASLQVLSRGPFQGAIGSFSDALSFRQFGTLILDNGYLVRGLGLASRRSDMLSGSSGGFFQSLDLVEARIDGKILFTTAAVTVGLSVEATDVDVTGHNVTNCAVPCYFVACGFFPTDPPGTYKPCFQTRVHLQGPPREVNVGLDLLDSSGSVALHQERPVTVPPEQDAVVFVQLPLYTEPNRPVTPGAYTVRATVGGSTATIRVQIR